MSNPDSILNRLLEPVDFIKVEDINHGAEHLYRVFVAKLDDNTSEYPVVIVMTKNKVNGSPKFRNINWSSIHFKRYRNAQDAYNVMTKFTTKELLNFPKYRLGNPPPITNEIIFRGHTDSQDHSKNVYTSDTCPYKVTISERMPKNVRDTNRIPHKIDFNYILNYGTDVVIER